MKGFGYTVFERMLRAELTEAEMKLLMYLAQKQNSAGSVEGLRTREISADTSISYDVVYKSLYGLEKKQLIWYERHIGGYGKWKIGIVDNILPEEDEAGNYINLEAGVFKQAEFCRMPVRSQLLFMEIFRHLDEEGNWNMNTGEFIKTYRELLNVTEYTFRIYIRMNKFFFTISVRDKQYWFSLKTAERNSEAGKEF